LDVHAPGSHDAQPGVEVEQQPPMGRGQRGRRRLRHGSVVHEQVRVDVDDRTHENLLADTATVTKSTRGAPLIMLIRLIKTTDKWPAQTSSMREYRRKLFSFLAEEWQRSYRHLRPMREAGHAERHGDDPPYRSARPAGAASVSSRRASY